MVDCKKKTFCELVEGINHVQRRNTRSFQGVQDTQQTKSVQASAAQTIFHGSDPPNLEKGNSYGSTIHLACGEISAN